MIRSYLKIACRDLLKYKTQNILSVTGLSIGLIVFLLGGYWYYWEHHFDSFHPQSKHTYALMTTGIFKTTDGLEGELSQIRQLAEKEVITLPEIAKVCCVSGVRYKVDGGERSWAEMVADSTFFNTFQHRMIEGNYHKTPYNANSVVLARKMAKHLYRDSSYTGKEVKINKEMSYIVVGVMKNYSQNSDLKFEYLILNTPRANIVKRSTIYVLLHSSINVSRLNKKVTSFRVKEAGTQKDTYSEWHSHLCSSPKVHVYCSPELEGRLQHVGILVTAGLLVLVNALMNLLILFIEQQQRKVRYNSTFSTLGASTLGLVGRNLLELIIPLFIAFLISMGACESLFPYYKDYTSLVVENNSCYLGTIRNTTRQEMFGTALWIYPLCCVVFFVIGLLPVIGLLKQGSHRASTSLRNELIIGQISIGALFLLTSCMFYSQYNFIIHTDKGFVIDYIRQVNLGYDATYNKDCSPFIATLKENSVIEGVTAPTQPILVFRGEQYCTLIANFPIEGQNFDKSEKDNCAIVQKNFPPSFGMKTKEGKQIQNQGTKDIVVNETRAHQLNTPPLTGCPIINDTGIDAKSYRISGILRGFYYCPIQYPLSRTFFMYKSNADAAKVYDGLRYFYIKVRPGKEKQVLEHVWQTYPGHNKGEITEDAQIIQLSTLMELFSRLEKMMFRVFLLLAILCILISSFEVYFLVSPSTEQCKEEIAIRKINGVRPSDILCSFFKEYLWLALAGNTIALLLGYIFIRRWPETYAYHTGFHGWLFICVFLFTRIIVVLSIIKQVIIAAKTNPAECMKSE